MNENVLLEAEEILKKPSKNTKLSILISVNLVVGITTLLNAVSQLISKGHFNSPARDNIYYPIGILFMFSSAIYAIHRLHSNKDNKSIWLTIFSYGTVAFLSIIVFSLLHTSSNPPLTILVDAWIAIPLIIIAGLVLNRWVALGIFSLSLINLVLAVNNIGFNFIYNTAWAFPDDKMISSIMMLEITYYLIAFLVIFFEAGMINKILEVIPTVIEKIRTGAAEKQKLEVDNARMGAELDVARQIQEMVLPSLEELKKTSGCKIVARMDPAEEVGGDYYEILTKGTTTYLGIGDVTDHGLQSGVVMLMAQSAFRTQVESVAHNSLPLKEALININSLLYNNVQIRMSDQRNMTLSISRLEGDTLTICGQHESLLIARKSGEIEEIDTGDLGMYIGMLDDISEDINELSLTIQPEERILFYTDGANEAVNESGEEYGVNRLKEIFQKNLNISTQEQLDNIYKDIYNFIGKEKIYDDITIVILEKVKSVIRANSNINEQNITKEVSQMDATLEREAIKYGDYDIIPDFLPSENHLHLQLQPIDLMTIWDRCGKTADFTASFLASSYNSDANVENSVSTISNELIENAAKFSKARDGKITLDIKNYANIIQIEVINQVSSEIKEPFEKFIKKLISSDIEKMYFEHLEQKAETDTGSGLGFMMMYKDFPVRFGYQFTELEKDTHEIRIKAFINV